MDLQTTWHIDRLWWWFKKASTNEHDSCHVEDLVDLTRKMPEESSSRRRAPIMAALALRVGCHPWARISAATLAVRMKRSSVTELGVSINVITADKRPATTETDDDTSRVSFHESGIGRWVADGGGLPCTNGFRFCFLSVSFTLRGIVKHARKSTTNTLSPGSKTECFLPSSM